MYNNINIDNLKVIRKELGLTQQEVSDYILCSRSLISHIECGIDSRTGAKASEYKVYIVNLFLARHNSTILGLLELSKLIKNT